MCEFASVCVSVGDKMNRLHLNEPLNFSNVNHFKLLLIIDSRLDESEFLSTNFALRRRCWHSISFIISIEIHYAGAVDFLRIFSNVFLKPNWIAFVCTGII